MVKQSMVMNIQMKKFNGMNGQDMNLSPSGLQSSRGDYMDK